MMLRSDVPLSGHEELLPYRALALRVISLAVHDLITPGHSASERETAREFLSGSRMLSHWCRLAEIHPDAIRHRLSDVARHRRGARRNRRLML